MQHIARAMQDAPTHIEPPPAIQFRCRVSTFALACPVDKLSTLHRPPRRMRRLPTHVLPCLAKARPLRPLRQRHPHRICGARFSGAGRHSLASLFCLPLRYLYEPVSLRPAKSPRRLFACRSPARASKARSGWYLGFWTADRALKRWLVARTFRPPRGSAKIVYEPSLYQYLPTALADT